MITVRSWETINTVLFSSWQRSSNNFIREFREGRSTPTRGSSRSRKSASEARALAITERCSWPPDSFDTSVFASSERPTISNALSTLALRPASQMLNKLFMFSVPNLTSSLTVMRMCLGRLAAACGTHPILPRSFFEKPSFP